jgi:hypothetical protein
VEGHPIPSRGGASKKMTAVANPISRQMVKQALIVEVLAAAAVLVPNGDEVARVDARLGPDVGFTWGKRLEGLACAPCCHFVLW